MRWAFWIRSFSSGVFLAFESGTVLADEVDEALKKPTAQRSLLRELRKRMQSSIETMRKIVQAFYDEDFSFGDLVKRGDHLRQPLTDCLIGNADDQDFKELFESMSIMELPEPREHGLTHASS